jgi:hypothetical protein
LTDQKPSTGPELLDLSSHYFGIDLFTNAMDEASSSSSAAAASLIVQHHQQEEYDVPVITLLLENPKKWNNLGPLLCCCLAVGITQIFVVGYDQCSVNGSHSAPMHVALVAFPSHKAAIERLAIQDSYQLVGLLKGAMDAFGHGDDSGYLVV